MSDKGVSLRPSTYVDVALIDDVDVVWSELGFAMWDYGGKREEKSPALYVKMTLPDDSEVVQYYSAGDASYWVPSDDAKRLLPIGTATALNSGCNLAILLKSLIESGYSEESFEDDITTLAGLNVHMDRQPAPKRPGLKQDDDREKTVLVVTKILGSGETKQAAAEAETADLTDRATEIVLDLIADKGGKTKRSAITPWILLKIPKGDPNRTELLKVAYSAAFLSTGPWNYNKATGAITLEE